MAHSCMPWFLINYGVRSRLLNHFYHSPVRRCDFNIVVLYCLILSMGEKQRYKWIKIRQSLALAAHLHLEFGDSALQAQELLLQGGLLPLEGGDLLLDAAVLSLLEIEVSFPKLCNWYISSSILTNSLDRLFLTSAVFIVSTDSRVSFSLLRIWTSFLWLFS